MKSVPFSVAKLSKSVSATSHPSAQKWVTYFMLSDHILRVFWVIELNFNTRKPAGSCRQFMPSWPRLLSTTCHHFDVRLVTRAQLSTTHQEKRTLVPAVMAAQVLHSADSALRGATPLSGRSAYAELVLLKRLWCPTPQPWSDTSGTCGAEHHYGNSGYQRGQCSHSL